MVMIFIPSNTALERHEYRLRKPDVDWMPENFFPIRVIDMQNSA